MTRNYFTSDLHLFHTLVQHLRGYANDDEQLDALRAAFSRVTKRDTVFILGDLNIGRLDATLDVIESLPGTKHLIYGNHDKGHPAYRGALAASARYRRAFASAGTAAQLRLAGTPVMLNHLPYDGEGDTRPDQPERFVQFRLRDLGIPLVHGHVHSPTRFTRSALGTPQVHIGLDAFPQLATQDDILDLLQQNGS